MTSPGTAGVIGGVFPPHSLWAGPRYPPLHSLMARLLPALVLGLAVASSALRAQEEPGTGLIFDLPSYRGTPYKAALTAQSYHGIPSSASLEEYCPTPGDQGKFGTCVAFSIAYHMRTVLYGLQRGITDRALLDANAFSPTFVYEQIKSPDDTTCQKGTNPINALELLKTSGVSRISTVPYACGSSISSNALLEAVDFTINDYQVLFMPEVTDRDVRVNTVRKAISEACPVVLCFTVVKSFYKAPRVWRSQPTDGGAEGQHGRHAMLVVGYDDNLEGGCFRVLNSWSPRWADGGFVWIPYDEFAKYALGAMQVYGPRPAANVKRPSGLKIRPDHLSGQMLFRERDATPMKAHRVQASNEDSLVAYKMDRSYASGTRFRFFVTTNTDAYVYAFATDLHGTVNKILPFDDGMSPLIGPDCTIAFPSETKVIRMDQQKGTDTLLVLYSDQPLNAKNLLEKLNQTNGSFTARVREALGSRLINDQAVEYSADEVSFQVARAKPGGVVPLMVEVDHD